MTSKHTSYYFSLEPSEQTIYNLDNLVRTGIVNYVVYKTSDEKTEGYLYRSRPFRRQTLAPIIPNITLRGLKGPLHRDNAYCFMIENETIVERGLHAKSNTREREEHKEKRRSVIKTITA